MLHQIKNKLYISIIYIPLLIGCESTNKEIPTVNSTASTKQGIYGSFKGISTLTDENGNNIEVNAHYLLHISHNNCSLSSVQSNGDIIDNKICLYNINNNYFSTQQPTTKFHISSVNETISKFKVTIEYSSVLNTTLKGSVNFTKIK